VPVLRHDWPSPYASVGAVIAALSGWDPIGIGSPSGYPSSFIAAPIAYALMNLLGVFAGTLVWQFAIAIIIALGARACTGAFTQSTVAQCAAVIFALFNPWVYNELVAGHAFMLLAYGGTLWLIREAVRPKGEAALLLCGLAIVPQIQFFVLDWPVFAYIAIRDRRYISGPAWLLLSIPIVTGVVATHSALAQTPLTLGWEHIQSIRPGSAVLLLGYFAKYERFEGLARAGLILVALCAAAGAASIFVRERRLMLIPLAALLTLAVACGFEGPWRAILGWAFAHITVLGLLRELYDLLGLTAACYLALCAYAARVSRYAAYVWCIGALSMSAGWFAQPPWVYWAAAEQVPRTAVAQPAHTRFALMPAFQPMQWAGVGSGIDPEWYVRPGAITPVNEFVASYPVSSALGAYVLHHDSTLLRALSVAAVYRQSDMRSDTPDLRFQWAFQRPQDVAAFSTSSPKSTVERLPALPEMTLSALPAVGTLETNIGAGNVLFGDAGAAASAGASVPISWKTLPPVLRVIAPNAWADAGQGWVDARLAFAQRPDLAQSYGGAVTRNSRAVLPVAPGHEALVSISGELATQTGTPLVRRTNGYTWIAIPPNTNGVRCSGVCVVAAQGDPRRLPLNPPPHKYLALPFRTATPWLASATIPRGEAALLRYNVAYDSHWIALYRTHALAHVRIDGIVNGWIVPARSAETGVLLIETGAAATSLAEVLCFAGIVVLLALAFYRDRRYPLTAIRPV
jgi:hypothetical protein